MARLKGVSPARIVLRHALPNAIGPIANAIALSLSYLLGGVVIVETIFNYPGIASLMVDAVTNRDMAAGSGLHDVVLYGVPDVGADCRPVRDSFQSEAEKSMNDRDHCEIADYDQLALGTISHGSVLARPDRRCDVCDLAARGLFGPWLAPHPVGRDRL